MAKSWSHSGIGIKEEFVFALVQRRFGVLSAAANVMMVSTFNEWHEDTAIEPTVIAAVGSDRVEDWGPSFQHLEGVRLSEEEGRFEVAEVIRRRTP